ncbi:MAG: hypothetical protein Q7R39_17290 [Dehalococcoidia bacterium]|nr:hypothetical protein [Dehalococcoidia bacterium]
MGFFDKIVAKATEVGADAAREAGKAAETGPLRLSIHGLHGKREELVGTFGTQALALFREGQIAHTGLDEIAARVASMDEEIKAKEAQLATVEEKYKTLKQ